MLKQYFENRKALLDKESTIYLNIKVIPKAQRTEAVEVLEGPDGEQVLKIKLAAVPEKGKANKLLCEYLAVQFDLPKSSVSVSQGETSQRKVVKLVVSS